MKVTFLEATVPLTKTFKLVDGKLSKEGHPKIVDYQSHHYTISHDDLAEFCELLKKHAALGHCLQKGNTTKELKWESRAGKSDANEATYVLCLDLDGVNGIATIRDLLDKLGLGNVDHIVQYSSSMGVDPGKGLSAHVFVLLDRAIMPDVLKQWLVNRNFAVPELERGIRLSSNSNALRWTLDITTCQSDKLIYIAPPLLGKGVVDSFKGERIELVRGDRRTASIDASQTRAASNEVLVAAKHDSLREAAGLPKKKWNRTKSKGEQDYMPNPDECTVTGIDKGEPFTYLNLNDGDSWGYYHSTNQPYFLRNFKGEPVYRLKDIVPSYWRSLRRELGLEVGKGGKVYLGFVEFRSGGYYRGTWDEKTRELDIAEARGPQQVADYLREHGQHVPDPLPTFRMVFDPSTTDRYRPKDKWINMYEPSEYALRASEVKPAEMPKVWRDVIFHALGSDEESYERFMNWAAALLQLREQLGSSWVLQGTHGTGKGLIYWELLEPLLGAGNCTSKRVEEFTSEFTGFMDKKLLIFVDDNTEENAVTAARLKQAGSVIKNITSEPKVSVRHMRQAHRLEKSFVNLILTANYSVAAIDPGDRRPNIAPFQHAKLPRPGPEGIAALRAARWEVYCHLMTRPFDREMARAGMDNAAKRDHADRETDSFSMTCRALHEGDYAYFLTHVETDWPQSMMQNDVEMLKEYNELVGKMKAWPNLQRSELMVLFRRICGKVNMASGPFKRSLANHQITLRQVWRPASEGQEARTVYGFPVRWKLNE